MKEPWFGTLLDWQWDPQTEQHVAWHNGRSHRIVKLDRRSAEAHQSQPGWHRIVDDEYGQPDIGDPLNGGVVDAKRAAEAWILCAESDMRQYPQLSRVFYSGVVDYDGLIVYREDDRQRFTVRYNGGEQVGLILPVFLGQGGTTSVRWRAHHLDGRLISGGDSWSDALTDLRAVVGPTSSAVAR